LRCSPFTPHPVKNLMVEHKSAVSYPPHSRLQLRLPRSLPSKT
jgi:hypothetical protein